jgi:hypothetical protein
MSVNIEEIVNDLMTTMDNEDVVRMAVMAVCEDQLNGVQGCWIGEEEKQAIYDCDEKVIPAAHLGTLEDGTQFGPIITCS